MIRELRKRPLCRPLLLFITGICISVYVPLDWTGISLLILFIGLVLILLHHVWKGNLYYESRWTNGLIFSILLLALFSSYVYYRLRLPASTDIPEWQLLLKQCQHSLVDTFDELKLSEWKKNVLATITFGYRDNLDWSVRHQFSLAGVAHILAVSGFHVGVVYAFFRACLFMLSDKTRSKYLKNVILICIIWTFVAVSGLAASAVRTALMLTFYLVGKTIRRRTDSYNTWCAAAFCMLVYNPFYLFDLGFELSFLAVLSILFFYKRIFGIFELKNPLVRVAWSWVAISIAAQIGTLPLCMYYFGETSAVSLLTALPVTLLSIILIPLGLLWSVLNLLDLHFIWLKNVLIWFTDTFCWFVESMSRIEPVTLVTPFSPLMLITIYISLFFVCLFIKYRRPKLLVSSLFFVFLYSLMVLIERLY